ncbi:MAG: hypothetical protein HY015_03735 [Bacteroidetes bacterium]|nr:hypothetical protein [Bacteroidota bacterium]MBI3482074.1 hypothetical protein [Bacteroidota bacterium]
MKKFYILALTFFCTTSWAQTVTVKSTNEKVKGDKLDGFSTELEGRHSDINSQWNKFLKEIGRVKLFSSEPVVITEPNFNGTVYPKGILYAHIFENGSITRVWLGIQPKEWDEKDVEFVNKQLEKMTYQFGIQFHRSKVQSQIDETSEAANAVEKQKQRLVNQNKDMTIQLGNNEQEKTHLDKAVDANKLEHEALLIKLERNKKAQDSLTNVGEQIKKVMTTHQERLRKIN